MLSECELTAWCRRLNLNEQARTLIDKIRSSEPARRVNGNRSNVSGLYPSRKMGVSIQFESHRVELAAIYEMEHDPLTLEFYDQPPPGTWFAAHQGERPTVRQHVVSKGETLSLIAARHGVPIASIRAANRMADDTVRIGARLEIPVAAAPR